MEVTSKGSVTKVEHDDDSRNQNPPKKSPHKTNRESIRSAVSHSRGRLAQVMKAEILNPCVALRQVESTLHVDQSSLCFRTWKVLDGAVVLPASHSLLIDPNETVFAVLRDSNVNHALRQVHVEPGKVENLTLPHSGVNRHRDNPLYLFMTLKLLE